MKKLIIGIALLACSAAYGQTAEERRHRVEKDLKEGVEFAWGYAARSCTAWARREDAHTKESWDIDAELCQEALDYYKLAVDALRILTQENN